MASQSTSESTSRRLSQVYLRPCLCAICNGKSVSRHVFEKHRREMHERSTGFHLRGGGLRGRGSRGNAVYAHARGRHGGPQPRAEPKYPDFSTISPSPSKVSTPSSFAQLSQEPGRHMPDTDDHMSIDIPPEIQEPNAPGSELMDIDNYENDLGTPSFDLMSGPIIATTAEDITVAPNPSFQSDADDFSGPDIPMRSVPTNTISSNVPADGSGGGIYPSTTPTFPDTPEELLEDSHALPPKPTLRRSGRVIKRVVKEVVPLTEAGREVALGSRDLGLYDDPEEGDDLQNELDAIFGPDLRTSGNADGDSSDERDEELHTLHGSMPVTDDDDLPNAMPSDNETESLDVNDLQPRRRVHEIYAQSHEQWFVRLTLVLAAHLHVRHHVTFRACALLLFVMRMIFIGLRLLPTDDPMPITLNSVIHKFELEDRFTIYPVCSDCHRIFNRHIPTDSKCPDCDIKLFTSKNPTMYERLTGRQAPPPPPKLAVPISPLSNLLVDVLAEGDTETVLEQWLDHHHEPGKFESMIDGEVPRTVRDNHGKLFFSRESLTEPTELRIGVTYSMDWFDMNQSNFCGSHSSGVMSFCLSGLPAETRYQTKNLLVPITMPGPSEPTAEQLQNYLKVIVDDLIKLYEEGVRIKTPLHPEGRLVRVFLLAIVCDHPAMCKACGFADHAHKEAPCTKCEVPHDQLFSEKSLKNGFKARDGAQHKARCYKWKSLDTQDERDAFFSEFGARWTEFARLSYFDLVRYTLVDPMHNILLGLAKTQWYVRWIKNDTLRASTPKKSRELDIIHRFLGTFESPLWSGKLPTRMGEPAGGSLTADEYKFATTVALPMIIPFVWDVFLEDAQKSHVKDQKKYKQAMLRYTKEVEAWDAREQAREERAAQEASALVSQSTQATKSKQQQKKNKKDDPRPTVPPPPELRMHEDEPNSFLKFATSLKILLGRTIDDSAVARALKLLQEYLLEYRQLYGETSMKPNHHWVVHVPDQIYDYGPVYGFWLFLVERLNKVLKNYNTNHRGGGQQEITLMRSFGRDKHVHSLVEHISDTTTHSVDRAIANRMLEKSGEDRGTIEAAASQLTLLQDAQSGLHIEPGPRVSKFTQSLSGHVLQALCSYYNSNGTQRVHLPLDRTPRGRPINSSGVFYEYALLDGRRIVPTSRTQRKTAGSSIVKVVLDGKLLAGEVQEIFRHEQATISDDTLWAHMRWMMGLEVDLDYWQEFPELEIKFWELGKYQDSDTDAPPAIIPFKYIRCQLSRGEYVNTEAKMWITTTMERHSSMNVAPT